MKAFLDFWLRWSDYSGITNRRDYVGAILFNLLLHILFVILFILICIFLGIVGIPGTWAETLPALVTTVVRVYDLAFFVPLLSATVRRLRDAGYSAKAFLWLLIPVLGMIAFFARLFEKSKQSEAET